MGGFLTGTPVADPAGGAAPPKPAAMVSKPENFKVIGTPVLVDGSTISRLIQFPDGSGRAETWEGQKWVPGGTTLKGLFTGSPVPQWRMPPSA